MYAADVGNCMLLDLSDHANFEVQLVKKKRAIEKKKSKLQCKDRYKPNYKCIFGIFFLSQSFCQ